ncbi:hypothetical protein B0J12DRAFT_694163 [Macrophomina phaseolina]|uniref:Uncharacterized protein n=1 Tax=Macrophomina phaseolina TaxID=35725 RepID=A0ABQ8GRY5_9PEZI|nr:hypothetical protein B0J12DRAFT_694163 [Macrophomina phaseolina]
MTEYTNGVRQIKANLKTVQYNITDDMLATALLHGLLSSFRSFKNYDWIWSIKPDNTPDLNHLYERLLIEEDEQNRLKEERGARDRARKEASSNNNNTNGGTGYNVVARQTTLKTLAGLKTQKKPHVRSRIGSPSIPTTSPPTI